MPWVLIYLSAGAFVAIALPLRLGATVGTHLQRQFPRWFVLVAICWLAFVLNDLRGEYDADDPLAILPGAANITFFAGIAASVPAVGLWLATSLVLWVHVDAVGYLAGAAERLLFVDPATATAWTADRLSVLLDFIEGAWWLPDYPGHIAAALLWPVARWTLPLLAVVLAAWCLALTRSALANTPTAPRPRPIAWRPLPTGVVLCAGLAAMSSSVLSGSTACVLALVGRIVWLVHVSTTLAWTLTRWPRVRRSLLPLALVAFVFLDAALAVVGLFGLFARGLWVLRSAARPTRSFAGLTHGLAIATALTTFAVLREVDVRIERPERHGTRSSERAGPLVARNVRSSDAALAACGDPASGLCPIQAWRNSVGRLAQGDATEWEWVSLPSPGGVAVGLAKDIAIGGEVIELSSRAELRAFVAPDGAAVRCCQRLNP